MTLCAPPPLFPALERPDRLPGYSYKLASAGRYGLDVAVSDEAEIDEQRMAFVLPFADGRHRDGVGDLLEVGGIDLSRHRRNPVALFDHGKQVVLPIGTTEDPATKEYTVALDPVSKLATAKVFVYQGSGLGANKEHALFCEQLFDLWCKRLIRGGSIGYQVIHARELGPDYERGTPKGLHLMSVLMLECSAVVMPANADTVAKALALPRVCGKPLSPWLVKSLTPYAEPRKAQMGYEGVGRVTAGELAAGVRVETEHTDDADTARKIAIDHLAEDPDYYRKLRKVEGKSQPSAKIDPDKARLNDPTAKVQAFPAPAQSGGKSLDAIRQKYRKGFRRNLKSSSPGRSLIHVKAGEADAARDYAGRLGLKVDWAGEKGGPAGTTKLRLTGDDAAIGKVAAKYGRRVKSMGGGRVPAKFNIGDRVIVQDDGRYPGKITNRAEDSRGWIYLVTLDIGTSSQYREDQMTAGKSLPTKGTKAMQPNDDVAAGPDLNGDGTVTADESEKYSAQVLRRMHQDATILLQDYDELKGPLEQDEVNSLVESRLERLVEDLEELEDLFAELHPDAEPLSGAKSADDEADDEEGETDQGDADTMDDAAVAAGSDPELEEPDPEEAAEAMKKEVKALHKQLRTRYGKNGDDKNMAKRRKSACPECGKEGCGCGKALTDDEAAKVEGKLDDVKDELAEEVADVEDKGLKSHERRPVGEAAGFLGELAQTSDFSDEHRMKSYHYHKTLEGIATLNAAHDKLEAGAKARDSEGHGWHRGRPKQRAAAVARMREENEWEGGYAAGGGEGKSHEGATGEKIAPAVAMAAGSALGSYMAGGKELPAHRKMCKNASDFLLRMSREKAFGDPHREEAARHAEALTGISKEDDVDDELTEEVEGEPGEVGEKALRRAFAEQQESINQLNAMLARLVG